MAKELERDLGLLSVIAISVGAMVGSGIFILPALALKLAGPAVVIAYFLAGLIVLPATLSKAEMATAMPEAGGTYVYIERSMGPLLGTIAGIGTWFSLTFKGALALVGGAPYIILLVDLPAIPLAVGLALALIALNMLGAKQTGRTQIVIVGAMLLAMIWFVGGSLGPIEASAFEGFYDKGTTGLLAAAGFVFVSYAGVTKVASVAEEIEDPGRNIPLGLLGSLGFTTALYVLIVIVLVGASEGLDLVGSHTPVADIAGKTLAQAGVIAVILAAILALISTANAGLLSSSRYPFAMSRDNLAPPQLAHISLRFETPTVAIGLTGAVIILLVVGVPIMEIAKLGSAFQILVFVLINVALVAFRESDVEGYDPEFRDPLYPWTQGFGVVGGLALLTQMGWLPMIGAVVIVGASVLWYYAYARSRVRREGVAREEVRRRAGSRAVDRTRTRFEAPEGYDLLVAVTDQTREDQETTLVDIATCIAAQRDGRVAVVRFDRVPDQLPLAQAASIKSDEDQAFEKRMEQYEPAADVPIEVGEVVSHDVRHSVVNFADHHDVSLLVVGSHTPSIWARLFGSENAWLMHHTTCDVLLVYADRISLEETEVVALVTDEEPFEPIKVKLADALATAAGARLLFVQGIAPDSSEDKRESVEAYHREVADLVSAPVDGRIVENRNPLELAASVDDADLVVIQTSGSPASARRQRKLLDALSGPVLVVRPRRDEQPGLLARLYERLAF